MEITRKAKEELEARIEKIEGFIAKKGLGSTYLQKAQKTQRDLNLAIVLGGIILIAGIAIWMNGEDKEG
jgi:ribosome-associated translation inhibitor RaiA